MRNLFSNDNSGYRLKTLQILNWGVFDKKVVTFSFDGKSTILTGLNGSGKTTTVDALLTLLIPSDKRFYNLSSDSSKKRERDEKNYVLGAYGFKQEEDSKAAQYLRQKNEVISILNGIFYEPNDSKYLSLLQVRYFSGEELKCLKIITEKELRIEDITQLLAKNNSQISQSSKWVQLLVNAYGSKSYDSFEKYKNSFMDKFGFRSDNALKLFSQTVGLKVLGDITSFIRGYMLEDKSPLEEYEKINCEFSNLMGIEKEMRKTEKKLEFLSKTIDLGDRYTVVQAELKAIEDSIEGLECWFISQVLTLGEQEIEKRELEISELKNEIEENRLKLNQLKELLISLKSNDVLSALKDLDRAINDAKALEKQKRERRNRYDGILSSFKDLGFDFVIANNKEAFNANRDKLPKFENKIREEKEKINSAVEENIIETKITQSKIGNVEEEIKSLEARENNIPASLVSLREDISRSTGIKTSSLPFLGELIKIKDSENVWMKAIESLLSSHSLMLIAQPDDYDAVTSYLDKNNLSDKIGIINRKPILKQRLSSEILTKIDIKDCPLSSWLKDYLENEFPHAFVQAEKMLLQTDFAVLPSGVIKTEEKIFKDDRIDALTGNFPQYLGWTNKERIEELYRLDNELNSKLEKLDVEKKNFKLRLEALQRGLSLIENLYEFVIYDEIDREGALTQLNEKEREKQEFLEKHTNLQDLQAKIDAIEQKEAIVSNKKDNLNRELGAKQNELDGLKKQVAGYKEKEDLRYRTEEISAFEAAYSGDLKYEDLSSLIAMHGLLKRKLVEERTAKEKVVQDASQKLSISMNNFLAPRNVDPDINWVNEYPDLVGEVIYYDDFKLLYAKLKDESMVELNEKFSKYLEDTLSRVVGTLAEELQSWDKDIKDAIKILNKNLGCIPFNKDVNSHLRVEAKLAGNKEYQIFADSLKKAIPDKYALVRSDESQRKNFYLQIKKFLDKYNNDERLKKRVLDLRNKYNFVIYEDNSEGNLHTYSDTGALSGGEKAKLTYTILAAALCYQYNLDNEDEKRKGPFRFVILDEAFSKSDAFNSQYALELFKELDLQLMVVTPRNGINLVESYISSLHLIEKRASSNTSTVSSMTIEEYRKTE